MQEKYKEQKYAVLDRNSQSESVFSSGCEETCDRVAKILNEKFSDNYLGKRFFVVKTVYNTKQEIHAFEEKVIESYTQTGKVFVH